MECRICFETSPRGKFKFLPCSHNLCKECLDKISNSCPFCRQPFREEDEDSDDGFYNDEDEMWWYEVPDDWENRPPATREYSQVGRQSRELSVLNPLPTSLDTLTFSGVTMETPPLPPLPASIETLTFRRLITLPPPLQFVSSTSLSNEVEEPCPKTESNIEVSRRLYFFKYLNMKKVNIISSEPTSPLIRIH